MRPTGLTVATYNLYLGADLAPLFDVAADDVAARATAVWAAVEDSRPVERMAAAARLILRHLPDAIGVQEVALWRAGIPEAERVHDLLARLLAELAAHGAPYRVATEVRGFSSAAFSSALCEATGQVVELHDRSAILIRDDPSVHCGATVAEPFQTRLTLPMLGHPIEVVRGWCAADVRIGSAELRLVNVHLESYDAKVRQAQARELVEALDRVPRDRRLIVLGDINCRPVGCRPERPEIPVPAREVDGDAYEILLGTGLVDAWASAHPDEVCGGFTSGQDARLRNAESRLDHRIDVILTDPRCTVGEVFVIGNAAEAKTRSGLWPSDHACVLAGLEA